MSGKRKSATLIKRALLSQSALLELVKDSLGALETSHREYFEREVRAHFEDSLDIDKAFLAGNEQDNRWDYLLGHTPSGEIVAVEPHSARQDEISTVIRKRKSAQGHLQQHLRSGKVIKRWLWVASGKVQFADTEKARRLLDQNGIQFVGNRVMAKHLR